MKKKTKRQSAPCSKADWFAEAAKAMHDAPMILAAWAAWEEKNWKNRSSFPGIEPERR
jgi:hypothetical protein